MVSASIPAGGPVSDEFSQQNPLEFLHVYDFHSRPRHIDSIEMAQQRKSATK